MSASEKKPSTAFIQEADVGVKWKVQARVACQPGADLGMLVGGVVVEHDVDDLAGRHGRLDGVEEADELAVAVALHAAAEDGALEDVERGEQCRRAVADVIVGLCRGMARCERQRGPRSLQRLDLAVLVDRQDNRMGGRVHVEADDVLDLLGESRVVRALEGAHAMRLQMVPLPNALDGAQRDADRLWRRRARSNASPPRVARSR